MPNDRSERREIVQITITVNCDKEDRILLLRAMDDLLETHARLKPGYNVSIYPSPLNQIGAERLNRPNPVGAAIGAKQ